MSLESVKEYREGCRKGDAVRDAGLVPPDDVRRFMDIPYGEHPENVLDVYVPKGTDRKLPTIVSIHGGGWVYGDKELYSHYCMRLAQRGFAVVNFSYRLAPENRYPAALEDCFKVFGWVLENADQYFIDTDNIFTVGDSARAQLEHQCLTILTNPDFAKIFDFPVPSYFKVRACALNCGVYYMLANKFKRFSMTEDYFPDDFAKYTEQLKVAKHMRPSFPPSFVMTAENDFLKIMAKPIYRKLKRLGVECELHVYGAKDRKDIGHVFHVNCKLEEAAKCNDDECAFFRRHMSRP